MPRRPIDNSVISPARAMRAAMQGLQRELRAAPPGKAGDLARKLAALAKDLAILETPSEREAAEAFSAAQL